MSTGKVKKNRVTVYFTKELQTKAKVYCAEKDASLTAITEKLWTELLEREGYLEKSSE